MIRVLTGTRRDAKGQTLLEDLRDDAFPLEHSGEQFSLSD